MQAVFIYSPVRWFVQYTARTAWLREPDRAQSCTKNHDSCEQDHIYCSFSAFDARHEANTISLSASSFAVRIPSGSANPFFFSS